MDKLLNPICRVDYSDDCQICMQRQIGRKCERKLNKLKNIQRGCLHVYSICKEIETSCTRLIWDVDENGFWRENIKGIDDYYLMER